MRRTRCSQRQTDLFDEPWEPKVLRADLRRRLAPLLQALLAEAAHIRQEHAREGDDEQDHA